MSELFTMHGGRETARGSPRRQRGGREHAGSTVHGDRGAGTLPGRELCQVWERARVPLSLTLSCDRRKFSYTVSKQVILSSLSIVTLESMPEMGEEVLIYCSNMYVFGTLLFVSSLLKVLC